MLFVDTFMLSLSILILTGPAIGHKDGINKCFEKINSDLVEFNKIAAGITWESSINPGNTQLPEKTAAYQRKRIAWQHTTCGMLSALQIAKLLNDTERRQSHLLCRGPLYNFDEARVTNALYEDIQSIYSNAEVCIPTSKTIRKTNGTEIEGAILNYLSTVKEDLNLDNYESAGITEKLKLSDEDGKGFCLKGESDFEMVFQRSRNEEVLRWLWLSWREAVGPPMKEPYGKLVRVENVASTRKGYTDIGAAWRDELEIPNLRQFCRRLYRSVEPLYKLLHGVVRYYLRREFGDIVPERGPIPAHLLGNLWADDWHSLVDLILPSDIDIDRSLSKMNWTVTHMVKRAEDFYQSLGLPPMTESFWRHSVFARQNNSTRCHGTAADMFQHGDFRLLYCAGTTAADLYVIHHEMGHIHYYMAYENQPGIFRQGANTAFHESIGDAVMYGVLTPQHLHRLGLINDSLLYTTVQYGDKDLLDDEDVSFRTEVRTDEASNQAGDGKEMDRQDAERFNEKDAKVAPEEVAFTSDDVLLLKQALNKLPQIPFALLIEEYRWKYFENRKKSPLVNEEFWALAFELQGIAPISERSDQYFDIGAKYHVPDNTPYVRYFLSSFLQHQLFEALCKAAVFGRRGVKEDVPPSIAMHRCDIYGSKAAGKLLKDIMSRGSSQHWRQILQATTGQDDISAEPLKRHYRPLHRLLKKLVRKHGIPIGW